MHHHHLVQCLFENVNSGYRPVDIAFCRLLNYKNIFGLVFKTCWRNLKYLHFVSITSSNKISCRQLKKNFIKDTWHPNSRPWMIQQLYTQSLSLNCVSQTYHFLLRFSITLFPAGTAECFITHQWCVHKKKLTLNFRQHENNAGKSMKLFFNFKPRC